jgi:hypothetical protein
MRLRTVCLMLVVGLVAALPATAASGGAPAPEKRAGKHCPDGAVCLWTDANYEGDKFVVRTHGLSNEVYDEGFNDVASSLKSGRDKRSFMYTDYDGGGIEMCVVPHLKADSLSLFGGMDNSISSSRLPRKGKKCDD